MTPPVLARRPNAFDETQPWRGHRFCRKPRPIRLPPEYAPHATNQFFSRAVRNRPCRCLFFENYKPDRKALMEP
jgi:hypothetical protein